MRTSARRPRPGPSALIAAISALAGSAGIAMGQSIVWYPNVPGTSGQSVTVTGLSPDGSVLIGAGCCNTHSNSFAFMCGPGGFTIVSDTSSSGSGSANGVSNGGTYAAVTQTNSITQSVRAYRWPGVNLGTLPGDSHGYATGISVDGSVVVGESSSSTSGHAFRWTQATGMVSLGTLPGRSDSAANAVSANGLVIAGTSGGTTFRWEEAMVDIGALPGSTYTSPAAVNADGSVIVGNAIVSGQYLAYRWTAATGMQSLGLMPGTIASYAYGVSGDGSVVVGYCKRDTDPTHNIPFMWTAALGLVDLNVYLPSVGISLGPPHTYILYEAGGISLDGRTIAGNANDSTHRLWIATLPPWVHCGTADFNCDGDVGTDADIDSFFACLSGTCPAAPCANSADFNQDGDVGTDADIDAFFRVLSGGTC